MINYRIKHIGINHPNAEEASKTAELFRNCFQLERTGGNGNGDIFVGKIFEFKDKNTVGTFGHVALQVDDVIEKTQLPTRRVLSALTVLEIDGYVQQGSGKHFSLSVTLLEE